MSVLLALIQMLSISTQSGNY